MHLVTFSPNAYAGAIGGFKGDARHGSSFDSRPFVYAFEAGIAVGRTATSIELCPHRVGLTGPGRTAGPAGHTRAGGQG